MITRATASLLTASLCVSAVACGRVAPGSTDIIGRDDAIDRISNEACDRAADCGNIGVGKGWDTANDCINAQKDAFSRRRSAAVCGSPHGLLGSKLFNCQEQVKQYTCTGNVFDLAGVLTECGEKDVCR